MNDFEPSKEQLETVYGGMMEEVNELRLQIARKKTLSAMDHQDKTINTNIAKVQAQIVVFWLLDDGPKGHPNNLPQPAWRLAELFFGSDMSWSQADLCANSYVISAHFSLLSKLPSCMRYISYVGIKRIIHNLLFRIIRNMLFVELGPTGFQVTCNCT